VIQYVAGAVAVLGGERTLCHVVLNVTWLALDVQSLLPGALLVERQIAALQLLPALPATYTAATSVCDGLQKVICCRMMPVIDWPAPLPGLK